jgi:hypothetical protein
MLKICTFLKKKLTLNILDVLISVNRYTPLALRALPLAGGEIPSYKYNPT